MINNKEIIYFITESNAIENINRSPTIAEIDEFTRFINLNELNIEECEQFLSIYQPNAKLRDKYDMNVKVGKYYPPFGNPNIRTQLVEILEESKINNSYMMHIKFEKLHPFTDGNGRLGRAIWAWGNKSDLSLGFLRAFYYQVLKYN